MSLLLFLPLFHFSSKYIWIICLNPINGKTTGTTWSNFFLINTISLVATLLWSAAPGLSWFTANSSVKFNYFSRPFLTFLIQREGLYRIQKSNQCDIDGGTLWPRSSSSFDFMHKYEKCKFNRLNIRKIMIYDWTHIRILREIYFCLRWKSGRHNSTLDTKRPGNPVLHNTVSLFCSPYVYLTHYFLYNLKCIFISSIYSAIMANNRKAFMYT